ncbi:MAG: hypothetical protein K0Q50_2561 [Vampirovibrio sp.]|jgi:hypothetical protein|nr:hypothetical protein [Vampirovibrio sp.]
MSMNIVRKGQYQLFETTQRYRMLSLDNRDFYIWRGADSLELSDLGHEAAEIMHQGDYLLFTPDSKAVTEETNLYLACQEGSRYRMYELTQGLPTEENRLVAIRETQERPTLNSLLH